MKVFFEDDYLKRKLENKSNFDATSGATEQDKFNNLSSDTKRTEAIEFNNISDSIAVPFFMGLYSLDVTNATMYYSGKVLKSIELNAEACKQRFDNKASGWFPILFSFFTPATSQSIIDAVRDYMSDYTNYAKFGVDYGDSERGLFDFIENTNGVITSLEDYPLISGEDYTSVKAALKTYFRG
jgi:hypothetical protein